MLETTKTTRKVLLFCDSGVTWIISEEQGSAVSDNAMTILAYDVARTATVQCDLLQSKTGFV